MPLKQDDESPNPIAEVQMLHDPNPLTELRSCPIHIKLERSLEPVHEYLGSD
jgi:hypothetical protein